MVQLIAFYAESKQIQGLVTRSLLGGKIAIVVFNQKTLKEKNSADNKR